MKPTVLNTSYVFQLSRCKMEPELEKKATPYMIELSEMVYYKMANEGGLK